MAMHDQPEAEPAEILREYGPYPGVSDIHGVTFDGTCMWFATGDSLRAVAPATGELVRSLAVRARAGTAFDGRFLYQLADDVIQKIDPESGEVLSRVPAPEPADGLSGMAWAEGFLWIGEYRARKIHKVDPATGKVVKSIESTRFVTGVTWAQGELWHGTMGDGPTELRQVDPSSGAVRRRLELPPGISASGLESDGNDVLYCGGASSGKVRAIRLPRRKS